MKFTHGYWHMRPGVTPHYPAQVQEVKASENSLTVYAPTRRIQHRGDTLDLALLTVRFSAPMPNVIRVQLSHHQGGRPRKPEFELKAQDLAEVRIQDGAREATLTSGELYDEEAVEVLRFYEVEVPPDALPVRRGLPAHEKGIPVMRAMLLEFPGDPACETLDRQYMLGDALLVAPIFSPDGIVDDYVPAGRWTHFLGGEVVEGPRWRREEHGFLSLPLLVRPGAIIPVGRQDDRPDYDYADGVTLQVYALPEDWHTSLAIPAMTGEVEAIFEVERAGLNADQSNAITVVRKKGKKPWQVLLVGISSVGAVEGGTAESDPQGTRIIPAGSMNELRMSISDIKNPTSGI